MLIKAMHVYKSYVTGHIYTDGQESVTPPNKMRKFMEKLGRILRHRTKIHIVYVCMNIITYIKHVHIFLSFNFEMYLPVMIHHLLCLAEKPDSKAYFSHQMP